MKRAYLTGKCILAAFLLAGVLAGCVVQQEYPPPLLPSVDTPPGPQEQADVYLDVTLFYRSTDGSELIKETRQVEWPPGVSRALCAIQALCAPPQRTDAAAVIPKTLTLEDVALSGDVCQVYFSGELPADETAFLIMRAALASTAGANEGSLYVDVYVNDMQPGYQGRPLGLLAPVEGSLFAYLTRLEQEYTLAPQGEEGEAGTFQNLDAQLFFSDISREFLLTQVRKIGYDSRADNTIILSALLGELFKGPTGSSGYETLLPPGMQLLHSRFVSPAASEQIPLGFTDSALVGAQAAPTENDLEETQTTPLEKESVLELYLLAPASPLSQEEMQKAYASIVLTATSFLPGIERVRLYTVDRAIQNEKAESQKLYSVVSSYISAEETLQRSMYTPILGQMVRLYFPEKSGQGLYAVPRTIPQSAYYAPLARLQALFSGSADPGVPFHFLSPEDVLSVYRYENNTLIANFREGFYEKLQAYILHGDTPLPTNQRASLFVFALVNTLCEFSGIERVWILEDGQPIDKGAGLVYLGNPLSRNPGLTRA